MRKKNKNTIYSILWIILFAFFLISSCAPLPKMPEIETLPSPSAYVERGMPYFQKRDFERATLYFKKAIESDMRYQPAHSYLALSYAHSGKKEKAIQEFKKVVEINSSTTDATNAQKWLKRLSEEPTAIGVFSFHFADRFQVWEGFVPLATRTMTYQGLATEALLKYLKKPKMYRIFDLSDIAYSQLKSDYAQEPPSSPELERLIHLASKNGAQLLLIPRIDYISVSGQPPYRRGKVVNPGMVFSGEVTMSVAIYSCKSQKLITTVTRDSSKIPFFSGAASYVGGVKGLFNSCSEEVVKKLLKHVL